MKHIIKHLIITSNTLVLFFTMLFSLNAFADPVEEFQHKLAQYQGKVVYVDFWASWCGPCRQSFPWMNTMQPSYGSKGFKIISINLDSDYGLAQQFLSQYSPSFDVIYDPKGLLAKKYQVQGMPSSFILDRESQVTSVHVGFTDNKSKQYQKEILTLLEP